MVAFKIWFVRGIYFQSLNKEWVQASGLDKKMNDLESSPIIESKRKRGRETFRQLKPIFCFVSFLMRVFPEFFCNWLLRALRYTRGSIGLGLRYILASRLAESCGDNVSIHDCVLSSVSYHYWSIATAKGTRLPLSGRPVGPASLPGGQISL